MPGVFPGKVYVDAVNYKEEKEKLLREIDKIIKTSEIWKGDRLSTIKWLVEEVKRTKI